MLTYRLAAAAVIVVTLLSTACTKPFMEPTIESRPPGNTEFPGIAQLVEQMSDKTVDVVIVHGMCTHDEEWAYSTIGQLSAMLGGPKDPQITTESVPNTKTTLYRARLTTPHGTIRAGAIVWSPIIAELKSDLCYDQTKKTKSCKALAPDAPEYPHQRASLNGVLKDGLLNDCLADAIIYEGKSRDAINSQMQRAILAIATPGGPQLTKEGLLRAAAQESTPIVFISESLGSKVAFDAIYKLQTSSDPNDRAAGVQTFNRFAHIFMGANQLPILALADQNLDGSLAVGAEQGYPIDPLGALLQSRRAGSSTLAAQPALRVVAFTDPNDILSYALARAKPVVPYDIVDVVVSNDATYFGFLERPDIAHTGYLANDAVTRLIACGSAGCP